MAAAGVRERGKWGEWSFNGDTVSVLLNEKVLDICSKTT